MKTVAEGLYPLRAVVRRTGLKPDLIRAWERRYGAIRPERSESNQRLFSESDVARLLLLRRAVRAGHSIRQIAGLADDELRDLSSAGEAGPGDEAQPAVDLAPYLSAIGKLDGEGLRLELEKSTVELGRIRFLENLLVPLMHELGSRCEQGELRIAHEHLTSTTVRAVVDTFRPSFPADGRAPLIVVATPAGQQHELGALLVAASARMEGWRVTYLGVNLPVEELAASVEATGATALALSVGLPESRDVLLGQLRRLKGVAPVELLVGGRGAALLSGELAQIGARFLPDLAELRKVLVELRQTASLSTTEFLPAG